jgi:hypothetical protein
VLSPTGTRPVVPVVVQEQNGREQEKYQEAGDVRFCDLGILPVTVKVGSDTLCNQVVVQNVPVAWRQPYLLLVTYDDASCGRLEYTPMSNPTCPVLFRVSDLAGNWVAGAKIEFPGNGQMSLETDTYGRAYLLLSVRRAVRAVVSASGYVPAHFTATCSGSVDRRERAIRLRKSAAR